MPHASAPAASRLLPNNALLMALCDARPFESRSFPRTWVQTRPAAPAPGFFYRSHQVRLMPMASRTLPECA